MVKDDGTKWNQMKSIEIAWIHMKSIEAKWHQMTSCESAWNELNQGKSTEIKGDRKLCELTRNQMNPSEIKCNQVASNEINRIQSDTSEIEIKCTHLQSNETNELTWNEMESN